MAERIATAPRGRGKRLTPRHRANIGAAMRGKRRADVSARQLGKKRPPEVGAKISAAMKGRPGWRVAGASEVSLGEAVDKYGYTRRALREARSANRIRGRQATRGKKTYILLDHQDASDGFPALERCVAPGCDGPALQDNGGCGRIGHGRRKPHSPEHRARIAEAKRGKPRPDLAGKPQAPEVIERRVATRKRNHPARRRTCRDCGVAIASGERCRSCAALERWAREGGDRSRALAAAHAGAEKYRRERSAHIEGLKSELGLLDVSQVAASYGTATNVISRKVAAGELIPERLEAGPHPRPLFAAAEVKRFERQRAFRDDGRATRWSDPDFVVPWLRATGYLQQRAATRGHSEAEQETLERAAIASRRARLAQRRKGGKRSRGRDERWMDVALDYLEERLPARINVTLPELLDAVRDYGWERHANDWPRGRYPAACDDSTSPSPVWGKKGRERVRAAIGAQLVAALADYHTLRTRR